MGNLRRGVEPRGTEEVTLSLLKSEKDLLKQGRAFQPDHQLRKFRWLLQLVDIIQGKERKGEIKAPSK